MTDANGKPTAVVNLTGILGNSTNVRVLKFVLRFVIILSAPYRMFVGAVSAFARKKRDQAARCNSLFLLLFTGAHSKLTFSCCYVVQAAKCLHRSCANASSKQFENVAIPYPLVFKYSLDAL